MKIAATISACLAFAALISARAQVLPATITSPSNETTAGFVVGADKDGVFLSFVADGRNPFKLPFTNIKDYTIEEPNGWSAAMALYQSGNLTEAARQFEAFGTALEKLVPLKDSFGSLAKYYWFLSLRGLGDFARLATVFERQLANPIVLSELFQEDLRDLQAWVLIGKKDWVGLNAWIKQFEEADPLLKLPQPGFKKTSKARLVSLCCQRGILHEQEGRKDLALLDYHSAMTLDLGADRGLASIASLGALRIVEERLRAAPDNDRLKRQAHALAVHHRDCFGKGKLPPEFEKLAAAQPANPPAPPPAPAK